MNDKVDDMHIDAAKNAEIERWLNTTKFQAATQKGIENGAYHLFLVEGFKNPAACEKFDDELSRACGQSKHAFIRRIGEDGKEMLYVLSPVVEKGFPRSTEVDVAAKLHKLAAKHGLSAYQYHNPQKTIDSAKEQGFLSK